MSSSDVCKPLPVPPRRELSVIAPCYNEDGNVALLAERVLAAFDRLGIDGELVLIDDGSRDTTWQRIQDQARLHNRVRGIEHAFNQGMETAWRTGLAAAAGELVCLIDADLQNRPEDIGLLWEAYRAGGCDLVQAVRRPRSGVRRLHLFSRLLSHMLNVIFHTRLRDNKSGFVLCRREVLASILRHRFGYRYYQSLLGVSAASRGYVIREVDTIFDDRHAGESFLPRLPLRISARIVWEMLKFRLECRLLARSQLGPAVRPGRQPARPDPVGLTEPEISTTGTLGETGRPVSAAHGH